MVSLKIYFFKYDTALSNPIWIALTSEDPFLTLFKLQHMMKKYSAEDDSFEHDFEEMSSKCVTLCEHLLNQVCMYVKNV